MSRALGYVKAHWKEFLALGLAAIPAFFIVFHQGAQKAASSAITYIPATFGGGTDPSAATDPTAAAAAQTTTLGSGTDQSGVTARPGIGGKIQAAALATILGNAQPGGIRTSVLGNTGTLVQSPKIKRRLP